MPWLEFFLCCLVIAVAGTQLSRFGDAIADKTGLGRTWVGVIMLAMVTSLPELVTGISSVTVADVPDIAVGDVLGSCVFNLMIIFLLDFMYRRQSLYLVASQGHILGAAFSIMLIGFAGFHILLSTSQSMPSFGHISSATPIIFLMYAVAMHTVFRYERREVAEYAEAREDAYPDITLRQAVTRYVIAALFVVAAGAWLPFVAGELAKQMGWTESFVGTLFVAFVTSLPEVVVTIAALRLGALDMAIGNLFGSNLFNSLVLAIDDVFFMKGPLFEYVSPAHAVSALSAVMMTGVAIVGLFYRPGTRLFRTVGWTSVVLFTIYLLNGYVIYLVASD